jgi:hypothetical protein
LCKDDKFNLIAYVLPGTYLGCDCGHEITVGKCPASSSCKEIPANNESNSVVTYRKSVVCATLGHRIMDLDVPTGDMHLCPSGSKRCGAKGDYICVPGDRCAITDILIKKKDENYEMDTYTAHPFKDDEHVLYAGRVETEAPIS